MNIDNCLDAVKNCRFCFMCRHLSAVAPVLFEQAPDGSVLSTPLADFMPFRMFCSYHRLRLMPAVSLDYYSDANPDTFVKIINEHHLAGLVLLVRTMPDDTWFEKTTKLLETTSANIIVIQREWPIFSDKPADDPAQTIATLREIQRGSLLFQPNEPSWRVRLQDYDLWNPGAAIPSATPQVVVLGAPAALARQLAATNSAILSATNSIPTNAVPVPTNAIPLSVTNAVPVSTNAVPLSVTNAPLPATEVNDKDDD